MRECHILHEILPLLGKITCYIIDRFLLWLIVLPKGRGTAVKELCGYNVTRTASPTTDY